MTGKTGLPEIHACGAGVPDMLSLGHPFVAGMKYKLFPDGRSLTFGYVGATAAQAMEIRDLVLTMPESRRHLRFPFALILFPGGHPGAQAEPGGIVLASKFADKRPGRRI